MNHRIDEQVLTELLTRELKVYEAITKMTKEERNALHGWVAGGNSVYENDSCYSQENGNPMAFLDAYRHNQDVLQALEIGGGHSE